MFSFTMFGTEVTYLLGSEASAEFWGSHNDDLNAEDLYANLTVPVFGKGVAYDVPHKVHSLPFIGVLACCINCVITLPPSYPPPSSPPP